MNLSKPVKIIIGILTVFAILFPFFYHASFCDVFYVQFWFSVFGPSIYPKPERH